MKKVIVTKVSKARWQKAQQFEADFAREILQTGDDWNLWWKKQFKDYATLKGKKLPRILEVGCGPHTNARIILPLIQTQEVYLEDPLLETYLEFEAPVGLAGRVKKRPAQRAFLWDILKDKRYRAHFSASPLEDLPFRDGLVDLVICINVLDHVYDYTSCMREMTRVLRRGGYLVLGQDLSNEEDFQQAPDSWKDVGHPIKLDEAALDAELGAFRSEFRRILPRQSGRNPRAHYGTYLGILKKR
jgi:SAM-dependent methyltransferase